jgi:hypothetical protein
MRRRIPWRRYQHTAEGERDMLFCIWRLVGPYGPMDPMLKALNKALGHRVVTLGTAIEAKGVKL